MVLSFLAKYFILFYKNSGMSSLLKLFLKKVTGWAFIRFSCLKTFVTCRAKGSKWLSFNYHHPWKRWSPGKGFEIFSWIIKSIDFIEEFLLNKIIYKLKFFIFSKILFLSLRFVQVEHNSYALLHNSYNIKSWLKTKKLLTREIKNMYENFLHIFPCNIIK